MKSSLSRRHHPPAPIVSLEIGALHGGDTIFVEAKVDTGADMCTIPDWVVTEPDMTPIRPAKRPPARVAYSSSRDTVSPPARISAGRKSTTSPRCSAGVFPRRDHTRARPAGIACASTSENGTSLIP